MAEKGAELFQLNIDDPASLNEAFKGVYVITFFWEHFSTQKEIEQAKSIAITEKENGVKHVI